MNLTGRDASPKGPINPDSGVRDEISRTPRRDVPIFDGRTTGAENIICPVCGAIAVQEKCKLICRSDVCRGRVVMNCSEF